MLACMRGVGLYSPSFCFREHHEWDVKTMCTTQMSKAKFNCTTFLHSITLERLFSRENLLVQTGQLFYRSCLILTKKVRTNPSISLFLSVIFCLSLQSSKV